MESAIRYLIVCLGNAPKYLLDKVKRLQNKCIKFLYCFNDYVSSAIIYAATSFKNVEILRTLVGTLNFRETLFIKNNISFEEKNKKGNKQR